MDFTAVVPNVEPLKVVESNKYSFDIINKPKWLQKIIKLFCEKFGTQCYITRIEDRYITINTNNLAQAIYEQDNAISQMAWVKTKYILVGMNKLDKIAKFSNEYCAPYASINLSAASDEMFFGKTLILVPWMRDDFILLPDDAL